MIKPAMLTCCIFASLMILAASGAAYAQMPPTPNVAEQTKVEKSAADWIEKRIIKLHDSLHITAAQEKSWQDVAAAMRDNAMSMKTLIDKWAAQADKMTALDSLKLHSEMAEEHAKGMRKLYPSFEALYNTMPAEQKALADQVFARHESRGKHKGK